MISASKIVIGFVILSTSFTLTSSECQVYDYSNNFQDKVGPYFTVTKYSDIDAAMYGIEPPTDGGNPGGAYLLGHKEQDSFQEIKVGKSNSLTISVSYWCHSKDTHLTIETKCHWTTKEFCKEKKKGWYTESWQEDCSPSSPSQNTIKISGNAKAEGQAVAYEYIHICTDGSTVPPQTTTEEITSSSTTATTTLTTTSTPTSTRESTTVTTTTTEMTSSSTEPTTTTTPVETSTTSEATLSSTSTTTDSSSVEHTSSTATTPQSTSSASTTVITTTISSTPTITTTTELTSSSRVPTITTTPTVLPSSEVSSSTSTTTDSSSVENTSASTTTTSPTSSTSIVTSPTSSISTVTISSTEEPGSSSTLDTKADTTISTENSESSSTLDTKASTTTEEYSNITDNPSDGDCGEPKCILGLTVTQFVIIALSSLMAFLLLVTVFMVYCFKTKRRIYIKERTAGPRFIDDVPQLPRIDPRLPPDRARTPMSGVNGDVVFIPRANTRYFHY